MRFEKFVRLDMGISDWKLEIKDSKIQSRSFTGPEHCRNLGNIVYSKNIKLGQFLVVEYSKVALIFTGISNQLTCRDKHVLLLLNLMATSKTPNTEPVLNKLVGPFIESLYLKLAMF